MVPNKPSSQQSFMMAQSTKKKWLAFHQNTLDKDHKKSEENRIAPPRVVHYIGFVFEYKMHKVGSLLSLYLENTRQEQEINKIHKWYGRQRELTQTLAREKASKTKANVKMINKFYHTKVTTNCQKTRSIWK